MTTQSFITDDDSDPDAPLPAPPPDVLDHPQEVANAHVPLREALPEDQRSTSATFLHRLFVPTERRS